jgi:hypothetical protein
MTPVSRALVVCLTLAAAPVRAQEPAALARTPIKQQFDLREPVKRQVSTSRSGAIKGAIIGFPIGAVAGVTIGAEACLREPQWHCAVKGGLVYSAIGALIGWLH